MDKPTPVRIESGARATETDEGKEPEVDYTLGQSALTRVRGSGATLTPAEKRIRAYLLSHVQSVARMKISDIAAGASTSKSSISRFCRKLGYRDFGEFRLAVAQETFSGVHHIHGAIDAGDSVGDIIRKICAVNVKAIENTLAVLIPENVERAAKAIAGAERIKIFSVGGSEAIAVDAYHKFLRIGLDCSFQMDMRFQEMQAVLCKPGEVALAFSMSGAERPVVNLMKKAKEGGATTICITNGLDSPITKYSDISLYGAFREHFHYTGTVESRIAQMYVLDCLFVVVAMMTMPESVENLEKTTAVLNAGRITGESDGKEGLPE